MRRGPAMDDGAGAGHGIALASSPSPPRVADVPFAPLQVWMTRTQWLRGLAAEAFCACAVFAGAAVAGLAILVAFFKLGIAGGIDILFYRGIVLSMLAFPLTACLVGVIGRAIGRASLREAIAAGFLSLGLNLSVLVIAPVTVDRSSACSFWAIWPRTSRRSSRPPTWRMHFAGYTSASSIRSSGGCASRSAPAMWSGRARATRSRRRVPPSCAGPAWWAGCSMPICALSIRHQNRRKRQEGQAERWIKETPGRGRRWRSGRHALSCAPAIGPRWSVHCRAGCTGSPNRG